MREIIRHMCLSSKHAIEKNGRKDVQEEIIFRLLFLVSFSRKGAIRFIYVRSGLSGNNEKMPHSKTPPIGAAAAEISRQFNKEKEKPQLGLARF